MIHLNTRTLAAMCSAAALSLGAAACATGGAMMSPGTLQNEATLHTFTTAVHMGEIEEAQLALSTSQNAQVRAFAQRMVDEHTMALQQEHQAMASMGINEGMMAGSGSMATMSDADRQRMQNAMLQNQYSRPVVQGHMQAMQMLRGLSGAAFDMAYMRRQVEAHQYTLTSLDRMMGAMGMNVSAAGSATMNHDMSASGGMSAHMHMDMQGRAMVAAHLQMAQQLVAGM